MNIKYLPFALLFLFVGGFGWFIPFFWKSLPDQDSLLGIEFPQGDLIGIAVDSEDNIYCASGMYQRVQVYSYNGKFNRAISVDSVGGDYSMKIENDRLLIATTRNKKVFTYECNTLELVETNDLASYSGLDENSRSIVDGTGARLRIVLDFISSRVVRTINTNHEEVVISSPFYLILIQAPFPAFLFFVIGTLLEVLFINKKFASSIMEKIRSLFPHSK